MPNGRRQRNRRPRSFRDQYTTLRHAPGCSRWSRTTPPEVKIRQPHGRWNSEAQSCGSHEPQKPWPPAHPLPGCNRHIRRRGKQQQPAAWYTGPSSDGSPGYSHRGSHPHGRAVSYENCSCKILPVTKRGCRLAAPPLLINRRDYAGTAASSRFRIRRTGRTGACQKQRRWPHPSFPSRD